MDTNKVSDTTFHEFIECMKANCKDFNAANAKVKYIDKEGWKVEVRVTRPKNKIKKSTR